MYKKTKKTKLYLGEGKENDQKQVEVEKSDEQNNIELIEKFTELATLLFTPVLKNTITFPYALQEVTERRRFFNKCFYAYHSSNFSKVLV